MKQFRTNLIYFLITAFIFLQAPVFIAGSTLRKDVKPVYSVKPEAKEEKSKQEIILETADSLFQNYKLLEAGLQQEAFELAYKGYYKLLEEGLVERPEVLTIADFSKPSNQKRLYIINMAEGRLIYHTLVAHGRNSGLYYATNFSNKPESNKSSLGFYLTLQTYIGEKGLSLKLKGLESGINNNAYDRAIVVHGSDYVTAQFANSNGYLGRSLGCPAVPAKQAKGIINTIKNGSVMFIYHPAKQYQTQSQLVNS
ncbi:MAG: murein L,D-transpeptidase catalytic domain family protein [Lacibacter sp.]